jgi:hypothetical protein
MLKRDKLNLCIDSIYNNPICVMPYQHDSDGYFQLIQIKKITNHFSAHYL